MDFNIEVRKKQLESLDQYITSSKDKVQSILDYLGWNSKKVIEKEAEIVCSVNSNHNVATKSINEHLGKCFLKSYGYETNNEFLSEPVNHPSTSIKLDRDMKISILNKARENNQKFKAAWNGQDSDPVTSDRLFTTFSTDERLALYDYCVQNTESLSLPHEFNMQIESKKEEKYLTQEEILAKERDAKRRRTKYKSVHTSRSKSHTEIMREVINNQMEQYKDYLTSKMEIKSCQTNVSQLHEQNLNNSHTDVDIIKKESENTIERPSSSISRHSNHSSSSKNKQEINQYEKSCKNYDHDNDYTRDYKQHENRHESNEKFKHSIQKEKRRYRDFEEGYRRSREKREWYHKSERKH